MSSKTKYNWEELFAFSDDNERIEHEADMLSLKIALEITNYLEEMGLSKKELAAMIGTSPAYITQILRGDKRINMVFLAKVMRTLNINFDIKCEEVMESDAEGNVFEEYQAYLPEAQEDEELAFHYFMRDTILEFKKLRKQKGITQSVLATRMGTKQTAVSRFESYSGETSLKFLHKYATALGVSLNALSGTGEFNLNIPTELYELAIQVYGNDSESVKSNILETISIEVKSRHEYKNEILQAFSSTGLYSSEDWSKDVVIIGGTS